jgi:hypothetical protein
MIQNEPSIYDEWKQRATMLHWTFVSDDRCPRRLVGRHCLDVRCWCGTVSAGDTVGTRLRHLNDHGATWSNGDGKRFVLWEPYGAECEDLAELIEVAHRDRLRVEICPSVWCPPYTTGIRFTDNRKGKE